MSQEFCQDLPDPWGSSKSLCENKFVRTFRSLLGAHSILYVDTPYVLFSLSTFS